MRKAAAALAAILMLATACGGDSSEGPQSRTVRVDFSHDEFASFFLEYFPRSLTLRPGDTAVFKQTWTGEPHSVTMGTLVDRMMKIVDPFIEKARSGKEELPDEPPPGVDEALEPLPWMFNEGFSAAQNGAQPCYLDSGEPPKDPDQACPKRQQPAFNGRQTYYNSGFIPFEGPGGNEFKVPLAGDIKPGTYFYYCNLHGPLMSGKIIVKPKGSDLPSQEQVNKRALAEIEKMAKPLRKEFEKAKKGTLSPPEEVRPALEARGLMKGRNFSGNLAGLFAEDESVHGGINEFIPPTIRVRTGEKVKWVVLGVHTVSFDVPRYFPIASFRSDGRVELNSKIEPPAGGSPPVPSRERRPPGEGGEDGPAGEEHGEGEGGPPGGGEEAAPEPVVLDAGTWNGTGFFSSGLVSGEPFLEYQLAFSKPGTYKYACLIHPEMVGTVVVS